MEDGIKNDEINRLIFSMHRLGCTYHRLHFPENVLLEIKLVISKGRWWDWLPDWAQLLRDFAKEIESASRACGMNRIDLTRRLLEISPSLEEEMNFISNGYFLLPLPSWEISQAIESWIFYHLRPSLRSILEMELDGKID